MEYKFFFEWFHAAEIIFSKYTINLLTVWLIYQEMLSRWRFQILLESEAYPEPCHTSNKMVKIVNSWKL